MKIISKNNKNTYHLLFASHLETVLQQLGEKWVLAACQAIANPEAQKIIKKYEKAGLDQQQIEEKLKNWYPGAAVEKVTNPLKSVLKKVNQLSMAEKEALLNALGV